MPSVCLSAKKDLKLEQLLDMMWAFTLLQTCNFIETSWWFLFLDFFSFLQIIPPANMARKFSAPGYLCPGPGGANNNTSTTNAHLPNPTNPSASLGPRKGSLCPVAQGFGFTPVSYSAPQWAGPTGACQVSVHNPSQLKQYQPPTTAPVSMQQGFHLGTTPALQKSVSPGGSNPRPT